MACSRKSSVVVLESFPHFSIANPWEKEICDDAKDCINELTTALDKFSVTPASNKQIKQLRKKVENCWIAVRGQSDSTLDKSKKEKSIEFLKVIEFNLLQLQINTSTCTLPNSIILPKELVNTAWKIMHIEQFKSRVIGSGNYGVVNLFTCKDGTQFATKTYKAQTDYITEVSMLSSYTTHENVVRLLGFISRQGVFELVLPYFSGGNLKDLMTQNPKGVKVELCDKIARGILSGVEHIHKHDIVHRDLKLENVAMDSERPVIVDFGLAVKIDPDKPKASGLCGTMEYIAPENAQKQKDFYPSPSADVWSVGCTLWKLVKRCHLIEDLASDLHEGDNVDYIDVCDVFFEYRDSVQVEIDEGLPELDKASPNLKQIILDCLRINSAMRPCAKAILERSFSATD